MAQMSKKSESLENFIDELKIDSKHDFSFLEV